MKLFSTNHNARMVSFYEAVMKGLPEDNGLYLPMFIPEIDPELIKNISNLNIQEISFQVAKYLIGDEISDEDLKKIVYSAIDFDAPLSKIEDHLFSLELYHGPTFAFKDFGARFMARLLAYYLNKEDQQVTILTATSGDTGSAVAYGFYNMPGIRVILLYPKGKISELQEKQLATLGGNIVVLEIDGTFDDCQILVKQAFLDQDINNTIKLTSANSINIARLIPQTFYYFYAYAKLAKRGNPVYFSVPSGNFGNLCGGVLAKKMGLPIAGFAAATNSNNTVPLYISTGKYQPKPSVKTISNAMDVGNPSNFARLIELYGNRHEILTRDIRGWAYGDSLVRKIIKKVYTENNYLLCPHSAIGYLGAHDLLMTVEEPVDCIFLSTAHPAKFYDIIEPIINEEITFPHTLKIILGKEKKSFPLKSDYRIFREFLLNLHGIV